MILRALLHVALALALPPLLLGVINRTKAAFAGRAGAPVLQPYHDIVRLLRKGSVQSETTTWVFRAGPVVTLASTLAAALLVPVGGHAAPVSFAGDLVLMAYLLGLGRFFTMSAALDTGSAFEGMGAAREATFASLAEPALFMAMLVLARVRSSLSLSAMLGPGLGGAWTVAGASMALVLVSATLVLLVECSRVPFDDPTTHLELTMIHEVMVLDHSGPGLAMILYGAALKLYVLGALVARVAAPYDGAGSEAVFVAALLGVVAAVGVIESVMARLRLERVPRLLVAAALLSALALVFVAR